jgi:hypothetical protein
MVRSKSAEGRTKARVFILAAPEMGRGDVPRLAEIALQHCTDDNMSLPEINT